MSNDLKDRLAAGTTTIGGWLSSPSPVVAEAMAACAFDWIAVDMEHGTAGVDQAAAIFVACERHGVAPIARLPAADPYLARRLLDSGAHGLIVPVVEDPAAFSAFTSHLRYPPEGSRGVGLSRCNQWGAAFSDYMENFEPVIVPQIETGAGVEAADAIAALPEVDALLVGPYDLSASLRRAGDFESERFEAALASVEDACRNHGKATGFHQVEPDTAQLKAKIDEGYRFIAFGTDLLAIHHTFSDLDDLK